MSLRKFLTDHKSSTNFTHLSISPNGKYRIENSELPTFYSLLAAESKSTHILESLERSYGPLLIDLDFEYPDEKRFHTRVALEFKVGERTPIRIVFEQYIADMGAAEKDHVSLDEFSKRLKRIYEIKQARMPTEYDAFGVCARIMSYKLK
jgi:hypothetical protein